MKCHEDKIFTNSSLKRKISGSNTSSTKYTKLKNNIKKYKVIETAYLNYAMFLAAAAVVAMMNQKSKLLNFTLHKVRRIKIKKTLNQIESCANLCYLNVTAVSSVAIRECLSIFKKIGNILASHNIHKSQSSCNTTWVPMLLIKRLEDIVEEKNRLAHLLLATIQENKNLKARSHLETVTKNKLMKLIEDSQTYLKDFKARFVNLQNLNYIVNQENISLKARVNKLTKQKVELDQNLIALVTKIYELKDKELMSFCDNLALNEESLQNIEIINEIRKLLQKSAPEAVETTEQFSDNKSSSSVATYLQPKILRDKGGRIVPFVSMKLKSKGHHDEYLWTVKDSDGLIERIYEYDNFGSDYDNGDMIRRIREYSVFCDKDCVFNRKR